MIALARPSAAIELELPGERKMEIHGFYEMRLSVVGPDAPFNSTFSQFRHVLNFETENEIFPDGWGPFDYLMAFTRWIVLYECIYERGCSTFGSIDSFGGSNRSIRRHPKQLGHTRASVAWNGGVLQQETRSRTLRKAREHFNPSQRFRGIENGPGELVNPNPLALVANSYSKSQLDGPRDEAMGEAARTRSGVFNNKLYVQLLAAARAPLAELNPLYPEILNKKLRDGQFLRSSPLSPERTVRNPDTGAKVRSAVENMLAQRLRALNGQIGRATGELQRPTVFGDDPNAVGDAVDSEEELQNLKNQRDTLLYRPRDRDFVNRATGEISDEPLPASEATLENAVLDLFLVDVLLGENDTGGAYDYQTFDEYEDLNLLRARLDPDKFSRIALGHGGLPPQQAEVVDALFARLERAQQGNVPYLATIDTPIEPVEGAFFRPLADYIDETAPGVSRDLQLICEKCLADIGATVSASSGDDAVPNFTGTDGRSDTRDDLPLLDASLGKGLYEVSSPFLYGGIWRVRESYLLAPDDPNSVAISLPRYQRLAAVTGLEDNRDTVKDKEDAGQGSRDMVLFGVLHPTLMQANGCIGQLGGAYLNMGTPGDATDDECVDRDDSSAQIATLDEAFVAGCRDQRKSRGLGVGINTEGDCVELNIFKGSWSSPPGVDPQVDANPEDIGVHPDLVPFLAFRDFRPENAHADSTDASDYLNFAEFGRTPPARPSAPRPGEKGARGLSSFRSPGLQKLIKSESGIVSNLDLDFTEDELKWGHGASEDEHEFREGYLEFEMFDSQLFSRIGKLLMVWGKTELFRNQDRLNPIDISNGFVTRLEEARIGQWAAQFVMSPDALVRIGPVEDLRLEVAMIFDDFEPTDLGKCGEGGGVALVCAKSLGAYAHQFIGAGLAGEVRPDKKYSWIQQMDFAMRLEGRWDRFTFSVSDFWGWDDGSVSTLLYEYDRVVDEFTGAPVSNGGTRCQYRTRDAAGRIGMTPDINHEDIVGPDGLRETDQDNLVASAGDCLLFTPTGDDPNDPRIDELRSNDEIRDLHTVNQTLFHFICTMTFDPDKGFCPLDRLNNAFDFVLTSQAIGGIGVSAATALRGLESIRLRQQPLVQKLPRQLQTERVLKPITPPSFVTHDELTLALYFEQGGTVATPRPEVGALLGCGPAYLLPCGSWGTNDGTANGARGAGFLSGVSRDASTKDRSVLDLFGPTVASSELPGGIDFMNADASVLLQEASVLKAITPGALVATQTTTFKGHTLRWEGGITIDGTPAPDLKMPLLDPNGRSTGSLSDDALIADDFAVLDLAERADLLARLGMARLRQSGLSQEQANQSYFGLLRMDPSNTASAQLWGKYRRSGGIFHPDEDDPEMRPTDGWIEPLPWEPDPEQLANGIILYQVANQFLQDPRCDAGEDGREEDGTGFGSPDDPNSDFVYCTTRSPTWFNQSSGLVDQATIMNDPTDPSNPDNVFIANPDDPNDPSYYLRVGENCTEFILTNQPVSNTFFDEGCSQLEFLSANLQRFFSVLDIIGPDQYFDPPETFRELDAMLDLNFERTRLEDRISGADGIFVRNRRVFRTDEVDYQVLRYDDRRPVKPIFVEEPTKSNGDSIDFDESDNIGEALGETAAEYWRDFAVNGENPDCAGKSAAQSCYLKVGQAKDIGGQKELPHVLALPVAFEATVREKTTQLNIDECRGFICRPYFNPNVPGKDKVLLNLAELEATDIILFSELISGSEVEVTAKWRQKLDGVLRGKTTDVKVLVRLTAGDESELARFFQQSISQQASDDPFAIFDLDEDRDGIYDGLDDYTPGPISDDNILCGSGVPGDTLQEGLQYELISDAEEEKFKAAFGDDGELFPVRSPVNCATVSSIVDVSGQTLPFKRAGGDGTYGRRDFQWQAGRQLTIEYQKRNVFGFALDFAEDTTRTSWGVEFSWIANQSIPNTNRYSGRSNSDIYVLSVSVDRPTFLSFINPNRSFFLNSQMFLRYVPDYHGGSDDKDGNYAAFADRWTGVLTATAFTGYFQDRLTPRVTFAWAWDTNTLAILWGMAYQFTQNLSTGVSLNHFLGSAGEVQRSYFPTVLNGSPKLTREGQSGIAAQRYRDEARFTVRYSW